MVCNDRSLFCTCWTNPGISMGLQALGCLCTMAAKDLSQEHYVSIDQAEFRRIMGHFASGVTVITACREGACYGITVSSFCSLSLEPPLVLICIDRRNSSHELIPQVGVFAVNILAENGEWLSRHFASREPDKFAKVGYRLGEHGAPLLNDALATIECRLVEQYPGGDHSIFVGEVLNVAAQDDRRPLLYFRSGYHRLG
jgi:flavin reductase (DIM6/NTAB) family NADH-FMN oxidoreductase RutF